MSVPRQNSEPQYSTVNRPAFHVAIGCGLLLLIDATIEPHGTGVNLAKLPSALACEARQPGIDCPRKVATMTAGEKLRWMVELAQEMKTAIAAGKSEEANKLADAMIRLAGSPQAPGPNVVSRGRNILSRGPKPIPPGGA